jgi:hypothetical protein
MPSFLKTNKTYSNTACGCDNSIDRNSAIFFNNLATKLLEMTTAIDNRIKKIEENCVSNRGSSGFLLASIETPVMSLSIKYEYVEYIKRYGPPPNGQFDQALLEEIRIELGITDNDNVV